MRNERWRHEDDGPARLAELAGLTRETGVLVVGFDGSGQGGPLDWAMLEGWVTSRAVTVADVGCALSSPGLEVALTSDLVVLRESATLELPPGHGKVPSALLWAAGRAGRGALARVLLAEGRLDPLEACDLGLAHAVAAAGAPLPIDAGVSVAALTAARDLVRAGGRGAAGALELASFRLLFATGHPREGARAFLERRPPRFRDG